MNKQMQNDDEINNVLFSVYYKKKIGLRHFFLTKKGFSLVVTIFILGFFNLLNGFIFGAIMLLLFYLYNKETIKAHEKDISVWLIQLRYKILVLLEEEGERVFNKKSNPQNLINTIKELRNE